METRQVIEVKSYGIFLNPMRSNTEARTLVAVSPSKEKLLEWYREQKANEPYYTIGDNWFPAKGNFPANEVEGHSFYKVFKQGGVLEWCNPMDDEENGIPNHHGHGIFDNWVKEKELQEYKMNLTFVEE